ncbi:MAG: hypothetical protein IJ617_04775 [Oscillospiraceae bacterium]|nr:hypothetical protein [Oscillospiraceae bacterium]
MANLWKAIAIVAAAMLISGLLLGGAGLLTGASMERIRDVMSGEIAELEAVYSQAQEAVAAGAQGE